MFFQTNMGCALAAILASPSHGHDVSWNSFAANVLQKHLGC